MRARAHTHAHKHTHTHLIFVFDFFYKRAYSSTFDDEIMKFKYIIQIQFDYALKISKPKLFPKPVVPN